MLRRSTLTIALATALFTLGIYIAGSPVATAISVGLLIFVAIVTMVIAWEHLKDSIVDELEQAHREATPSSLNQESVHRHEVRRWSPGKADRVVRFHGSPLAEIALTPEQLPSAMHSSRHVPYDMR